MPNRSRSGSVRLACALFTGLICFTPPVRQLAQSPSQIDLPLGQKADFPIAVPPMGQVTSSNDRVADVKSDVKRSGAASVAVLSRDVGEATISSKLFGVLPWKAVHVNVTKPEYVYVGGQSIGVQLRANGVMVVGYQRIGGGDSPGLKGHVEIADVIQNVEGHSVKSVRDLSEGVNEAPTSTVHLVVLRGHNRKVVSIHTVTDSHGVRRLGLYVRDKTAGIGTLTFYDPLHHRFGALGHVISDVDTGQPIEGSGSMYEAEVTGMVKGAAGRPGEKQGRFRAQNAEIGHIAENTDFGVFGQMQTRPSHSFYAAKLPVALPSQVHEGHAQLLTVLHGQKVEAFDVDICNLTTQERPSTKSMVLHVTDQRLLKETGGIVQGMSGSPIIQDGRLVGAVTHVFLSDSTRGYGVYAQWMYRTALSAPHKD